MHVLGFYVKILHESTKHARFTLVPPFTPLYHNGKSSITYSVHIVASNPAVPACEKKLGRLGSRLYV